MAKAKPQEFVLGLVLWLLCRGRRAENGAPRAKVHRRPLGASLSAGKAEVIQVDVVKFRP